ncbi:hypothetical protein [Marinomonas spartinae]|uniref:hypothetical protein n=1 Tax=Marinomonas spartinae TaxID=1792290 RepID=UPI0018F1E08C|nr:hypothetical protein [Marinomonas spartinae]MBJ7556127.1 hypothetical protein [Marinomonas spartinae]
MDGISGASAAASYAREAYTAKLSQDAQVQQGQRALELLASTDSNPKANPTPAASSGSHMTTDNLGQNININV